MFIDATKRTDVAAFAELVADRANPAFAAFLIDEELMVDSGEELVKLEKLADAMGLTKGEFCAAVMSHSKETLDNFFRTVYDHIVNGKDRYDANSVGGFCQDEIDKICRYLEEN